MRMLRRLLIFLIFSVVKLPGQIVSEIIFHTYRKLLGVPNFETKYTQILIRNNYKQNRDHALYNLKSYPKESVWICLLTSSTLIALSFTVSFYAATVFFNLANLDIFSFVLYLLALSLFLAAAPSYRDQTAIRAHLKTIKPMLLFRIPLGVINVFVAIDNVAKNFYADIVAGIAITAIATNAILYYGFGFPWPLN